MNTFQLLILGSTLLLFSIPIAAQRIFELMETEGTNLKEVQDEAATYFDRVGTGKGTGYKLFKRWEHHALTNLQKDGTLLSKKTHMAAIKSSKKALNIDAKVNSPSDWIELGPLAMNSGVNGYAPGIGRITAIYVEPMMQKTIYVGAPGGGLWKSSNGGKSWTPLGDQFENMNIWAIEVDPTNTDIVYIGNSAGELHKSTDGGLNFTTTPLLDVKGILREVLINPNNTKDMYATAINDGLYHTTNGGNDWIKVINDDIEDVLFKPGSTAIVYACGDNFYRSSNSGTSFSKVTQGIEATDRMKLAVSPANSDYVYIVQKGSAKGFGYLYQSTDSGKSFTVQSDATDGDFIGNQSGRDMAIAVSDTNINEVHIGGKDLYKSIDGGHSFVKESSWIYTNDALPYVHIDTEVLQYIEGVIYVGCDGGIFKSNDAGASFTDLSVGLGIQQFYRIANAASNKDLIAGGSQDNGSVITSDPLHSWMQYYGADGTGAMIDPNDERIIYGAAQFGGLVKTINRGANILSAFIKPPENGQGLWVTPMDMDPNNSSRIYAGYWNLYRHDNAGISGNWINVSENVAFPQKLAHIEVCPSNSDVIYVATSTLGALYKSTNITSASPTWNQLLAASSLGGNITDIAVDPYDENRIAVATSFGDIVLSTDGGAIWTNIDDGLPATSIKTMVFDRSPDKGIYVGINGVVFYKSNRVTNWTVFSDNLPNVAITELELYYDKAVQEDSRIRVATYGRGLWESPLYDDQKIDENSCIDGLMHPYTSIEAEDFCEQSGIAIATDGHSISHIEDGDYIMFNSVAFGIIGDASTFEANVAGAASGGTIEIRLDEPTGRLLGNCAVSNTGGWFNWSDVSCPISLVTGDHDVYLVFKGGDGYLFNINSFTFSALTLSDESPTTLESEGRKVLLFPNPISTIMHLQLRTAGEETKVSITNLVGQVVRTATFDTHQGLNLLKMNIEDLSSGFYNVIILKGKTKLIKTMVIQQ